MGPEQRRLAKLCRIADLLVGRFARMDVRCDYALDEIGPFLAAANHRSLSDLLVGMSAFHRLNIQPQILFKKAFLPGPLSKIAELAGVIVVRGKGATEAGIEAVNNGSSLMIMIEGGLFYNPDDPKELGPVKSGIARMARASQRPMVAMGVAGTEKLWPKGSWPRLNPIKRKDIVFVVGEPWIPTDEDDQASADELSAGISALIVS